MARQFAPRLFSFSFLFSSFTSSDQVNGGRRLTAMCGHQSPSTNQGAALLPLKSVLFKKKNKALPPIHTAFKLPSPLPPFPPGDGFARGSIDIGGLEVLRISTFKTVWTTHEGGPGNLGATFFEPSLIPDEYFMLGCYAQSNNKPLFGHVLVGKDLADNDDSRGQALKSPADYTLVWSSVSSKIKQDGSGYIWLPVPPDGYKAVGHVVTTTPEKPGRDRIRCVRSDLTDQCEINTWIWGEDDAVSPDGLSVFHLRPVNRGTRDQGIQVGTFSAQIDKGGNANNASLSCLKNTNQETLYSSMPNLDQIEALVQAYSPLIYFHPNEEYLPSSVTWFFNNGGLLYTKGQETHPARIEPTGSNLPQGGSNDGSYWLDLPIDEGAKKFVMKGDLQTSEGYLHIKPMQGATLTDIAIWVFYPFNGPARAKVGFINLSLGQIGEHIGDWEHLTLRISNFNGELESVYFSQHSSGTWYNASELEFENGNKPVAYASLHGHAFYSKAGLVLQGNDLVGIRNDTAKSRQVMDTGARFSVVAAEYLGLQVTEPPWLNYFRQWGPKISYDLDREIKKVGKLLLGKLKTAFVQLVKSLPAELLGEEGPTGPKVKTNWNGDES